MKKHPKNLIGISALVLLLSSTSGYARDDYNGIGNGNPNCQGRGCGTADTSAVSYSSAQEVPEIDAAGALSVFALLAGIITMVAERKKRS